MLELESILGYLAEASSFGGGADVPFAGSSDHWSISAKDVSLGRIPEGTTKSVFNAAKHAANGSKDMGSVQVALSIRTLRPLSGGDCFPALMMGGVLDERGRLTTVPGTSAWIPLNRVGTDEYYNEDVVVCGIDTYRAHQAGLATLPNDGTWTVNFERAIDLFDSVNELDDDLLREHGLRMDDTRCLMRLWPAFDDTLMASHVLSTVLTSHQHETEVTEDADKTDAAVREPSEPLLKLLGKNTQENEHEALEEDAFLLRKLVCGIPDHLPQLAPDDHQAIATVAMRQSGNVAVLRAPKGTHTHRVSLAILANGLTTQALRGDDMTTLVCIAPMADLHSMAHILATRPSAGLVDITSRWLPRIDDLRGSRRTLGPLGSLCLAHTQDSNAREAKALEGCLTKSSQRMGEGSAMPYADPWYTPRASTYYLDCVSSYLGERVHSPNEAADILSELLRHIDQDRCELIDSFAEVCKAWELHQQRESIVQSIVELRKEHATCKDRLRFWEEISRMHPPRRQIFSRTPQSQGPIIAEHALEGEELALAHDLLEDVCVAYRAKIDRIEANLDRLRGASANLTRRIRPASEASRRCAELASRLSQDSGLNAQQSETLASLVEGRGEDVSLVALDAVLDQTIRPTEFWLAVHVYEARWLELCQPGTHSQTILHEKSMESLCLWGNLCPFGLIPEDFAVSTLHAYGSKALEEEGLRWGLVAALHANNIETPRGMAVAAMCDSLALMGTSSSLGTHVLRGKTFDELRVLATHDYDAWHDLQATRLAVSSGVTFFDYALEAFESACANLTDVEGTDDELASFRSELMPEEQVHAHHASDEGDDTDLGILPPLSYVLVPDSSWAQVGPSRQNNAEAQAIRRWLGNHEAEIRQTYGSHAGASVAVVAPFKAQANLLYQTLASGDNAIAGLEVVTLQDLANATWPIVIFSTTCGPTALRCQGTTSARTVLSIAASAAEDALVLFCGGAWLRSAEDVAIRTMRRALRVGRLFSKPLSHTDRKEPAPKANDEERAEIDLRATPLALHAFIAKLGEQGVIGRMVPASLVMQALEKVGLVETFEVQEGASGSRPTAAGREIGIVAITDRAGSTSCAFSNEAVPVIASLIDAMGTD